VNDPSDATRDEADLQPFEPTDGEPSEAHEPALVVLRGSTRHPRRLIRRGVTVVGSGSRCGIRLCHAEVAPAHCLMLRTGRSLFLRDLMTEHGTFVNGERVRKQFIKHDDEIRVGPFRLRVDIPAGLDEPEAAGLDLSGPGAEVVALEEMVTQVQRRERKLERGEQRLIRHRARRRERYEARKRRLREESERLAGLHGQLEGNLAKLKQLGEATDRLAEQLEERKSILDARMAELGARQEAVGESEAVLRDEQARAEELRADLQQRQSRLDGEHEELTSVREQFETQQEELASAREQLEAQREELTSAREQFETRQEELVKARHDHERAVTEQKSRQAELDRQEEAVAAAEVELHRRQDALQAREAEVAEREEAIRRRQQEVVQIQDEALKEMDLRRQALEAEADRLRQGHAELAERERAQRQRQQDVLESREEAHQQIQRQREAAVPPAQVGLAQSPDEFEVFELLGRGLLGPVKRARNRRTGEACALKLLEAKWADNSRVVMGFVRGSRTAVTLDHPNVARVLSVQTEPDVFTVMELVDGLSLDRLVGLGGRADLVVALALARDMLEGLAYAHRSGFLHRNLVPARVMASVDGHVKLLGFGRPQPLQRQRLEAGHADSLFVAGEVLLEDSAVDARADVFSVGAILFYLLSGESPFPEDRHAQVLGAGQPMDPRRLVDYARDVPSEVQDLVGEALCPDPSDRWVSCAMMQHALDRLLVEYAPPSDKPPGTEQVAALVKSLMVKQAPSE